MPKPLFRLHCLVPAITALASMSGLAHAAPACPATGDVGPCYIDWDYLSRQDFAGGNTTTTNPITPRVVATDLGVAAPTYDIDGAHYQIFANPTSPNGRLLVFAPGQPDPPQHYWQFALRAVQRGYNVIVISYWNNDPDAGSDRCNSVFASPAFPMSTRESCYSSLYEGIFRDVAGMSTAFRGTPPAGTPTGNALVVADQMQNRLRKVLLYLAEHYPNQGWKQFAADGNNGYDTAPYLDWSKVTLAGHSTGSKLMAHVAKDVAVHALLMLSGPNAWVDDASGNPHCPADIAVGATPASNMYVYYNTNDPKASHAEACHLALGLNALGRDSITGSYVADNAHVIYNSALAQSSCDSGNASGESSHLSTAEDCAVQPNGSGILSPSFSQTSAVWDYLLAR